MWLYKFTGAAKFLVASNIVAPVRNRNRGKLRGDFRVRGNILYVVPGAECWRRGVKETPSGCFRVEFAAVFLAYRLFFFSRWSPAREHFAPWLQIAAGRRKTIASRESFNVAATLSFYDSRRGVLRKHQQFRLPVTLSTRDALHTCRSLFVVCSSSCINCGCILRRCPFAFYFYLFFSLVRWYRDAKAAGAHERKRHPVLFYAILGCHLFHVSFFRWNFDASTNIIWAKSIDNANCYLILFPVYVLMLNFF